MRTFIQLKDNIGFAVINTENETSGVEVAFGTGEEYLNKTYSNGEWNSSPLILFAELKNDNSILEIKKTYFLSEVKDLPIVTEEVKPYFKYVEGKWIDPNEEEPTE